MNINLNLLLAFIEVAEKGSFRRAAEAVGRTQSAVSMQIQQLEAQLGRKLFSRTTRRVGMTPEGEQLLSQVRPALDDLLAGLRQASGLVAAHRGRVAIACAPSVAGTRLPAVLAEFQGAHPGVHARLRELPLAGIVESVRMGEVDFGIGPPPPARQGLAFRRVLVDPIVAVFRDGTFAGRDAVALAAMADRPVVLMGGLRPAMEAAARAAGTALPVRYEAQQILTVLGLVRAGLGVGIVPGIAIPPGLETGLTARPIAGLTRAFGIITATGRAVSPVAAALIGLLHRRLPGEG